MSATQDLVTVGVGLDTTQLERDVNDLIAVFGGMSEEIKAALQGASDALAGLGKEAENGIDDLDDIGHLFDALDDLGTDAGDSMSGFADALSGLGRESSRTTRGLAGFAAALSVVSPSAGAAARGIINMTRALNVLRIGLGPIAIGLTALTVGYTLWAKAQEQAAQAAADAQAVTDALSSSQRRLKDAYDEVAAAASEAARREQELANARRSAFAESLPGLQEVARQISTVKSEITTLEDDLRSRDVDVGMQMRGVSNDTEEQIKNRINRLADRLKILQSDERQLIEDLRDEAKARAEALQITYDQTDASRAEVAAKKDEADEARRLAEALALRAEVADITRQAEQSLMSPAERVNALYQERIDRLDQIGQLTGGTADLAAAYAAVEQQREQELFDLLQQHQQKLAADREAEHQKALKEIQERKKAQQDAFNDAAAFYGALSAIGRQVADERAKTDKRSAQRALTFSKRAAAAEATLSYAVGIQNAVSRNAGRPGAAILTPIAIAAVTAAYAQQLAAIGSTTLHQGGLAPDETREGSTTVLRDERRMPNGRVLSPEASRRLERGEGETMNLRVVQTYQHFGLFFPGYVKGNTSVLTTQLKRGQPTGRGTY